MIDGSKILDRIGERRHILLLQGPVGPFFDHLARFLTGCGRVVSKVNFNGGDEWYYRQPGAIPFCDGPAAWPTYFEELVEAQGIEAVILFGDCRPYHRSAILRARALEVPVFVFEEGYVRPNYITFEYGGVNGHSLLPRSRVLLQSMAGRIGNTRPPRRSFGRMATQAALYYVAGRLRRSKYTNYRHHKPFDLYPETWYWVRAAWRRWVCLWSERGIERRLAGPLRKQFFLVPLQVFNDSQVKHHSDLKGVRPFITDVIESFARNAPADIHLVFKHHPMDRGHRDYGAQIERHSSRLGIRERVHYIHDQHLPTLLRAALGTVVINSTVGLSSLFHGTPVKLLGRAIYDMPHLVFPGSLDDFWRDPPAPDAESVRIFREYLIGMTQIGGSFYSLRGIAALSRGLQDGEPSPSSADRGGVSARLPVVYDVRETDPLRCWTYRYRPSCIMCRADDVPHSMALDRIARNVHADAAGGWHAPRCYSGGSPAGA